MIELELSEEEAENLRQALDQVTRKEAPVAAPGSEAAAPPPAGEAEPPPKPP